MAELPTVLECCRLWAAPPLASFWRWSADGSAIEWQDGGTLLLRAELEQFTRHRVAGGRGLPPLQAIVFLFALLRDRARAAALTPADDLPPTDGLWERIRQRPELRRQLVDCALFAARCNTKEFAERVAQGLARELPATTFAPRAFDAVAPARIADWLRLGLPSLTDERLDLLARTGVDEVPAAADVALPPAASGDALLRRLVDDPELCELAAAARQVQAALRLSHARLRRDEAATGGFAGVTNRGPLDRLLPSELAHDADVLAVRVATNEALYALREESLARPRSRRRVLLDAGIRMWGTPRVLGVAVALAVRASAPADVEVEVLHADGAGVRLVDLGSREGLVRQLARVDQTLDVRAALPAFLAAPARGGAADEPIVVTHPAAAADPAFLARCVTPATSCRVVTVDELGGLRLLEPIGSALREVISARLRLGSMQRRPLTQRPEYLRCTRPPLSHSRKDQPLRALLAIGVVASRIVLQTGKGRCFELHQTNGPNVTLRSVEAPRPGALVGLAPVGDPALVGVAAWGERWIVQFAADGLLHWLPRHDGDAELALALDHARSARAWCSGLRRTLTGAELVARLAALVRAWEGPP